MEEQNSFDEFFRESLGDYRETPPPAAWEMVADRLDEDDRRRKRGFFYWPWITLSLLLMVGAWWLYGWSNKERLHFSSRQAQPTGADIRMVQPGADASQPDAGSRPRRTGAEMAKTASSGHDAGSAGIPDYTRTNTDKNKQASTGNAATVPAPSGSELSTTANSGNSAVRSHTMQRISARVIKQSAMRPARTGPAQQPDPAQGTGSAASAAAVVTGVRSQPLNTGGAVTANKPGQPGNEAAAPQQTGIAALAASGLKISPSGTASALQPVPGFAASDPGGNESRKPAAGISPLTTTPATPANPAQPSSVPAVTGRPSTSAGPEPVGTPLVNPAPVAIKPEALMAAIEPVMHFFAGAALPPVIGLYETGLLEPERYQPPVEPVIPVVASAPDTAMMPAMLPPDSNQGPAKRIMSLAAFFGYERGIKTPPQNMFTAGLRMLWQLSEKVSVGMQPALIYGNLPQTTLTSDKAYQRSATDVSRFITRDISPSILGQIDTVNNYVIREAFDSIIVRGTYLKGSLWQLELPLILQFTPFGPAFRIYGGPSMHFGGSMKIQSEGPRQVYSFDRKDSVVQSARMTEEQLRNYFGKSKLESYSNYDPNAHTFQNLDPVRFGYHFGIGYQRNRMSVDLSVRQQLSGYHQLSPELRQLYMNPVFRLGVGFMLIPQRVKQPKPAIQ